MTALIDLSGERFGALLVLGRADTPVGYTRAFWRCQCDCGRISLAVSGVSLRRGHTTSCGCKQGNRDIVHGATRRSGRLPEYNVWTKMKKRCSDPQSPDYKNYGGRGIAVCDRWRGSFKAFIEDMGRRPSHRHSIDRINNDGPYAPENCRWATASEQALNRRPRVAAAFCSHGHPLSGENLYIRANGKRCCRECRRLTLRAFYARHKERADAA